MLNIDNNISNWKVPSTKSPAESWEAIQAKIGAGEQTKVIPLFSRNSTWLSMAASLALLVSLVFFLNQDSLQSFETAYGERETIELPDGSTVFLNAGSSIEFDADNWVKERLVELEGEAFFQVKKGKNFSVQSSNGLVQVLGTSFNVRNRKGLYQVSCKTGKVRVSNEKGEQILTPGLRTELLNYKMTSPEKCTLNQIDSWIDGGVYHFDNIPLVEALKEIERQYNVTIDSSSISPSLMVNADVNLTNVNEALEVLCTSFGLYYTNTSEQNYTVLKK